MVIVAEAGEIIVLHVRHALLFISLLYIANNNIKFLG